MPIHWIIVASRDHVQLGIAGGFAQANHGKQEPLKRLQAGDNVIYYSPKVTLGKPDVCQAFTAIGEVCDDAVFQVVMNPDFAPFRRRVAYWASQEVAIQPLLASLSFIPDKRHWGAPFRYGLLRIPAADYQQLAERMLPV